MRRRRRRAVSSNCAGICGARLDGNVLVRGAAADVRVSTTASATTLHLLFVYHKVLNWPTTRRSRCTRAAAYQLREALAVVVDGGGGGAAAPAAPPCRRTPARAATRGRGRRRRRRRPLAAPRPAAADEPCSICFDALDAKAAADVDRRRGCRDPRGCERGAGPAVATSHCARGAAGITANCLGRWSVRGEHRGRECPVCRCGWRADDPAVPSPRHGGRRRRRAA